MKSITQILTLLALGVSTITSVHLMKRVEALEDRVEWLEQSFKEAMNQLNLGG